MVDHERTHQAEANTCQHHQTCPQVCDQKQGDQKDTNTCQYQITKQLFTNYLQTRNTLNLYCMVYSKCLVENLIFKPFQYNGEMNSFELFLNLGKILLNDKQVFVQATKTCLSTGRLVY